MPKIPFIRDLKNQQKKKNRIQEPVSISQKIYNSKQWKNLRNSYIAEHPLCERCEQMGKVTSAEAVHHKIPFLSGFTQAEIENLAYDWDNLMSVCNACHNFLHQEMGGYGNYSNL